MTQKRNALHLHFGSVTREVTSLVSVKCARHQDRQRDGTTGFHYHTRTDNATSPPGRVSRPLMNVQPRAAVTLVTRLTGRCYSKKMTEIKVITEVTAVTRVFAGLTNRIRAAGVLWPLVGVRALRSAASLY
jgi:hypothetical protein